MRKTKKQPAVRRNAQERSVTGALRAAIEQRGETDYSLGKLAGVDPGMISRYMRGSDLRGATIDRLADALGLALVERSRGRGRPGRDRPSAPIRGREGPDRSILDGADDVGRDDPAPEGPGNDAQGEGSL